MTSAPIQFGARSHPGTRRQNNEDAFQIGPSFVAVADGMGGNAGGETAAQIACDVVKVTTDNGSSDQTLRQIFSEAHRKILDEAARRPELRGMGCALVAVAPAGAGYISVAHAGDCRAYLLRRVAIEGEVALSPAYAPLIRRPSGASLVCLTRDHSSVRELVERGHLDRAAGRAHPLRSRLTRALGGSSGEPDVAGVSVQSGDRLLLCSDGLWESVEDEVIAEITERSLLETACDALIEAALQRGGRDNVTVLIGDIGA